MIGPGRSMVGVFCGGTILRNQRKKRKSEKAKKRKSEKAKSLVNSECLAILI